jgi:transcriptional regulator with XRE-family HTH domain
MKLTLKQARRLKGLTQEQAAELIGVSRRTLINWEMKATRPRKAQAEELCNYYGIKISKLVKGEYK